MSDEQTTMSNNMLEKIVCAIVECPLQFCQAEEDLRRRREARRA
jgi:hypothetical protein